MIISVKSSESSLITLSFVCIRFFVRVFEDILISVFQEGIERALKVFKKAFFKAEFVPFSLYYLLTLGRCYPAYSECLRKRLPPGKNQINRNMKISLPYLIILGSLLYQGRFFCNQPREET